MRGWCTTGYGCACQGRTCRQEHNGERRTRALSNCKSDACTMHGRLCGLILKLYRISISTSTSTITITITIISISKSRRSSSCSPKRRIVPRFVPRASGGAGTPLRPRTPAPIHHHQARLRVAPPQPLQLGRVTGHASIQWSSASTRGGLQAAPTRQGAHAVLRPRPVHGVHGGGGRGAGGACVATGGVALAGTLEAGAVGSARHGCARVAGGGEDLWGHRVCTARTSRRRQPLATSLRIICVP